MNTNDVLLTLAKHAICSDHGVPYDAYCVLNQLTKRCCGIDLNDYTEAALGRRLLRRIRAT